MTDTVLAIFGPTASGKTAIAQAVAERAPGGARLRRLDAGLPRPADPHEPGLPLGWSGSGARPRGLGRRVSAARTRCDRRDPRVGTHADRRRRDGPLSPGSPVQTCRFHLHRSRASASASNSSTTRKALKARTADSPSSTSKRQQPSIRTTAGASSAASSSRGGRASANRLWTDDTRHPTLVFGLDVPKGELDRRIAERTRAHVRSRRPRGGGARLAGPVSSTAAYAHGLSDIAEHPDDDDAIEALTARTRRYAAYQRKWMRRIPGLVSLLADRPPGEVADAILEVARARQRLPAGRAG